MIIVTNLRGEEFTVNCDLETISENPDTTMLLTSGKVYIVRESMKEVINKAVEYHKMIHSGIY